MAKQEQSTLDKLRQAAKVAEERPDILPALKFGNTQTEEGYHTVEFTEAQIRSFRAVSPFSDGKEQDVFAINVRVVDTDFSGGLPGDYQITMSSDPEHSLTSGILKLWKRNNESLFGVTARISTANYFNKKYRKEVRGYHVTQVRVPESSEP